MPASLIADFKLKLTTIFIFTLVITCSVAAQADSKVYRLKMAESWPTNFPVFSDSTRKFSTMVEKMSNGRLQIRVDSANKHKSALGVFDMVRGGQYDMGHSSSYFWKGKDLNTLFFTGMPFGMTPPEQYSWFMYGGGQELMDKVYSKYGLLSFPGGNTSGQMGGWFRKPITSVEDLKGLKMRIPGFAGEILAELGAAPVNIPAGELYTALERGTIDALEWAGPSMDYRMGFHKIAKYYYTGWHEPAAELQFLINQRSWNRLPEDLQAILMTAMQASAMDTYIHSYHASGVNLEKLKQEHPDVQILSLPNSVLAALKEVNKRLIKEMARQNPLSQEIIQSQANYLKQVRAWTEISDKAYLNTVSQ